MVKRISVVAVVLCAAGLLIAATEQQQSPALPDGAVAAVRAFMAALSNADLDGLPSSASGRPAAGHPT
jgi:hypothetical protein